MPSPTDPAEIRRQHIIAKATDIFLRYGHARTTMSDIAQAAGLSRPTLYLSFPDKDGIFRAVVEALVATKMATLHDVIAAPGDLRTRLAAICLSWTVDGYELVRAYPDAKDMFDLGFAVVRESYALFDDVLTELFTPYAAQLPPGLSPNLLARTLTAGLKGLKDIAADSEDLRHMTRGLTDTVAASLRTT